MKFLRLIFAFLAIGFTFNGCIKEPSHSLRITNEFGERINSVTVGSVSYGTIISGSTTEYKPIVEDVSHSLSGKTTSGGILSGSVSVTGKGTHKWTMKILSSGGLEFKEDK